MPNALNRTERIRYRMFCKNCGKEAPEDSRFCSSCGSSVQANNKKEPVTPRNLSNALVVVVILGVLILTICIGIYLL